MANPIESQIKDRISSFVSELDVLVRKSTLEALRGVLDTRAAPARRGRPAGSGRGPGRPMSSGNIDGAAQRVVSFIQANDGQGVREIAAGTGISVKVAKKAAVQLLAAGALKKSGVRRGTVYHVGSGRPARAAKAKAAKRGKRRGKRAKAA